MPLGGQWIEIAAVDLAVDNLDLIKLAVDGHRVVPVCHTHRESRVLGVLREVVDLDELSLNLADVIGHPHIKPPVKS